MGIYTGVSVDAILDELRDELNEAIENARGPHIPGGTRRQHSRELVKTIFMDVLRELPEHISVSELLEVLQE